jgi:hypothetical protein
MEVWVQRLSERWRLASEYVLSSQRPLGTGILEISKCIPENYLGIRFTLSTCGYGKKEIH